MIEEGIVESIKGNIAIVKLEKKEACKMCKACGVSGQSEFMLLDVENSIGAKEGERVRLEIDENFLFKATIISYGIPFMGFITGILIGYFLFNRIFSIANYEVLSFILGIFSSICFVVFFGRWKERFVGRYKVTVLERINI